MLVFGLVVGTDRTIYGVSFNVFTSTRSIGTILIHDDFESEICSIRSVNFFCVNQMRFGVYPPPRGVTIPWSLSSPAICRETIP